MIDVMIRNLSDAFGYGIWVYDKDEATGHVRVLESVGEFTWKENEIGQLLPKPIFSTSMREGEIIFEKFIERLKEAGYGRNKVSVESGELKATKEHLADMKKLVFTPPSHLITPIVISKNVNETPPMWQSRVLGTPYGSKPETVEVKISRVRRAAKTCSTAKDILIELFPELFREGWRNETD